jgi:hypothetical protein
MLPEKNHNKSNTFQKVSNTKFGFPPPPPEKSRIQGALTCEQLYISENGCTRQPQPDVTELTELLSVLGERMLYFAHATAALYLTFGNPKGEIMVTCSFGKCLELIYYVSTFTLVFSDISFLHWPMFTSGSDHMVICADV